MRYIIAIADDDRRPLDKLCQKLTAADIACDVMRNAFGGAENSFGGKPAADVR
jgi:hypothetical protein